MSNAVRVTKSRWASRPLDNQPASMPPYNHPALISGHTIYPTTVRAARDDRALKSADNSRKIGGQILKGKWAGFPIFTLTLEERATCPTKLSSLAELLSATKCNGRIACRRGRIWNGGWRAKWRSSNIYHPNGFAVRLHVLGDFYSVEYVELWRTLLERHSALHVWGYTARWQVKDDPIAAAIVSLVERDWDRFAIRFSNAPSPFEASATISIEHPYQVPADAILCPEQVGKTESCSTCALCWQSKRRVAFLQH